VGLETLYLGVAEDTFSSSELRSSMTSVDAMGVAEVGVNFWVERQER
jgi:hypothetical protein